MCVFDTYALNKPHIGPGKAAGAPDLLLVIAHPAKVCFVPSPHHILNLHSINKHSLFKKNMSN